MGQKLDKRKRVGRFAIAGALNTVIDFGVLNVLALGLSVPRVIANTVSTTIAMVFSYLMNHHFVFHSSKQKTARHFLQFLVITGIGLYIIQNGLIYLMSHYFTWPGQVSYDIIHALLGSRISRDFISLNTAKLVASLVSLTWNYILYSQVLFKHDPDTTPEPPVL